MAIERQGAWRCEVCENIPVSRASEEEEEDQQSFENRICRALWRNKAQDFSPVIEEGGRLKPGSLLGLELETGEEGV